MTTEEHGPLMIAGLPTRSASFSTPANRKDKDLDPRT
jgi:hypothetical protein